MHSPLPITPHLPSFAPFPRLPGEIRNHIWKICVQDYPARIIDLREYRRKIDTHTRAIAGFKSRAPRPTLLYTCRDSRAIAQASYIKAFGADMPAETWIDFEKDMLYLSSDFCYAALEGYRGEVYSVRWPRYDTEREEPFGYFLKGNPFNQDIQKVKDLAVTGLWKLGLSPLGALICRDITILVELFANLERFTLIDAQHSPDLTADLFLEPVEPHHLSTYDSYDQYNITNYRDYIFDENLHWYTYEPWLPETMGIHTVFAGLKPYPWFEFGFLAERQLKDCKKSAGIRPRRTGSRLATKEDRVRAVPDAKVRVFMVGHED